MPAAPSPERQCAAAPLLSACACGLQGSQLMAQPDELIDFHHLKARRGMSQLEIEDEVATDLQRATGMTDAGTADSNRLNRVLQLTGEPAGGRAPTGPLPAARASLRVNCWTTCIQSLRRLPGLTGVKLWLKLAAWRVMPRPGLVSRRAAP